MNAEIAHKLLLPSCLALFPARFDSLPARAMMLAVALQESDFIHRQQLVGAFRNWWESITGPATSFWQFELIGVRGVMEHHTTGPMLRSVCEMLGYPFDAKVLHKAMTYDMLLGVIMARLALYRHPQPLPGRDDPQAGWKQYIDIWRPGKPHPDKWAACFAEAWRVVDKG